MPYVTLRFCCLQIVIGVVLLGSLPFSWAKSSASITPHLKYQVQSFGDIYAAAFSADNKYLACASEGWPSEGEFTPLNFHGLLTLWNAQTGQLIRRKLLHNRLDSLAFAPDGKTLVSIGYGDRNTPAGATKIQVWDVSSGQLKKTLAHDESGRGIAFSPRRPLVAIGDGQEVILYNTRTWQIQCVLHGFISGYISHIAFSPNGKTVAGVSVASHTGTGELAVWGVRSGRRLYYSGEDNSSAEYLDGPVAFLSDGQDLACGVMKLRMHPLSKQLKPILRAWVGNTQDCFERCLSYSTQGSPRAVTACYEKGNVLNIWNVERHRLYCQWVYNIRDFRAISLNSKLIATSAGAVLKVWTLP